MVKNSYVQESRAFSHTLLATFATIDESKALNEFILTTTQQHFAYTEFTTNHKTRDSDGFQPRDV